MAWKKSSVRVRSAPLARCTLRGDAVTDGTTTSPAAAPADAPAADAAKTPDGLLDHLLRGTLLTWWAEQQPDRLAIVSDHGDRTFAELDARANQLVPRAAAARRGAGRVGRAPVPQPAGVGRGVGRVHARRLPPHADQLAPHRRGSRLHRRRLRSAGARRRRARRRDRRRGRRRARRGATVRLAVGGEIEGFDDYDAAVAAEDDARARRPVVRLADALHVGHHRSAEGRDPRRRCRAGTTGGDDHGELLRLPPRRRRAPVHRPAVPRGAARVLADAAARSAARPSC